MERTPGHRVSDPKQGEVGVCNGEKVAIAVDRWAHVKRWIKYVHLLRTTGPRFLSIG